MKYTWWMGALIIAGLLGSCEQDPKSAYQAQVRKELASGDRQDSIFFGIYLGMPRDDFYNHCWKMNKEGKFIQGTGNTSVQYVLEEEFPYPAYMNFYPDFRDKKIAAMPTYIGYRTWAPWIKETHSDALILEVKALLEDWYGPGFMLIPEENGQPAYYKVDGNREIKLELEDEQRVKFTVTDLEQMREEILN